MEKLKVIDQYTKELKVSEYKRADIIELVSCGVKGWKKKMEGRLTTGKMYRSAASTLTLRCRKKTNRKNKLV